MTQDAYPMNVVRHRMAVAQRLAAGECGGWYGDAILIISSAIGALAADLFPGIGIDRRRFVQLWVRYADPALKPLQISVPLLAQELHKSGDHKSLTGLQNLRPDVISLFPAMVDSLVLDGARADASESEVQTACPVLTLAVIRKFSYPNLFYSEIRSGFVHEGDTTSLGSSHPGGTRKADISYANVMQEPFRRIHFTVTWLSKLTETIAANAFADIYKARVPLPLTWWLDGVGA